MAKKPKSKGPEAATRMVSFRADADLLMHIQDYATKDGRKVADAVRRLVMKGLSLSVDEMVADIRRASKVDDTNRDFMCGIDTAIEVLEARKR